MSSDDRLMEQETLIHWDESPNGLHFIYTTNRPLLTRLKKMGYKMTIGGNLELPKGSVKLKDWAGGGTEGVF